MKLSNTQSSTAKIAIYWDFENVHLALCGKDSHQQRESRFNCQPKLVNIAAVMGAARKFGMVCINRAYSNWNSYSSYESTLTDNGIDMHHIPHRGFNGKNGADIQMCVDMIEDALRLEFDTCIIISGDSDFSGAVKKLRQYGKRIIGIGVHGSSSRLLQRLCDEYHFYEALESQKRQTLTLGSCADTPKRNEVLTLISDTDTLKRKRPSGYVLLKPHGAVVSHSSPPSNGDVIALLD